MRLKEYAKPDVKDRIIDLHPYCLLILCDVLKWGIEKQVNILITDANTSEIEDKALNRVSSTHREGRAFDLSIRGWTKDQIDECVRIFSLKYRHLAALDQSAEPKLVYLHDAGSGNHLHFQINRRYALPVLEYKLTEKSK